MHNTMHNKQCTIYMTICTIHVLLNQLCSPLFQGEMDQEKVFGEVLNRKKAYLDYKNKDL